MRQLAVGRLVGFLAVLGLLVGCGGGGGGSAPDATIVSITSPLAVTDPFTVEGRGFPKVAVTIRFEATSDTPFLGGTSAVVEVSGTVRSSTAIDGVTPALQATGDVVVRIELAFAGGATVVSGGPATTLLGPRLDGIEPDVFDATQPTPFVLHGRWLDSTAPSPVLRVAAIGGTHLDGGQSDAIEVPIAVENATRATGLMPALSGPSAKPGPSRAAFGETAFEEGEGGWAAASLTVVFSDGFQGVYESYPPPNCELENVPQAAVDPGPELQHDVRLVRGTSFEKAEVQASGYSWFIDGRPDIGGPTLHDSEPGPFRLHVPRYSVPFLHALVWDDDTEDTLDITVTTSEVTPGGLVGLLCISLTHVVVARVSSEIAANETGDLVLELHAAEVRIQDLTTTGADAAWNFERRTGSAPTGGLVEEKEHPEHAVHFEGFLGGGAVDGLRSFGFEARLDPETADASPDAPLPKLPARLHLDVVAPGVTPGLYYALLSETRVPAVQATHGPPPDDLARIGARQTWTLEDGFVATWRLSAAARGHVETAATLVFGGVRVEVEPFDQQGKRLDSSIAEWDVDGETGSSFDAVGLGAQSAADLGASTVYYDHVLVVGGQRVPLTRLAWSVRGPESIAAGGSNDSGDEAEAGPLEIDALGGGWMPGLLAAAYEHANLGQVVIETHDRWGRDWYRWTLDEPVVLDFMNEARGGEPAEVRIRLTVSKLTLDAYGHTEGATGPAARLGTATFDFRRGFADGNVVLPPLPPVDDGWEGLLVTPGTSAALLRAPRTIRWSIERVGERARSELEIVASPDVALPGLLSVLLRQEEFPELTAERRRAAAGEVDAHVPFEFTLSDALLREMSVQIASGRRPAQSLLLGMRTLHLRTEVPGSVEATQPLEATWDFQEDTGTGNPAFTGATLDDLLFDTSNVDDAGVVSFDPRDHVVVEAFTWGGASPAQIVGSPRAVPDPAHFFIRGSRPAAGLLAAVTSGARTNSLLLRWYPPSTGDARPDAYLVWQLAEPLITRVEFVASAEDDALSFVATGGAVRLARFRLEEGEKPFRVAQVDWDDPGADPITLFEAQLPGIPEHRAEPGEPSFALLTADGAWADGVLAYGGDTWRDVKRFEPPGRVSFGDVVVKMPANAFSPRWIEALVVGHHHPEVKVEQWMMDERRSTLTLEDVLVRRYATRAVRGAGVIDTLSLSFGTWWMAVQEYDSENDDFLPEEVVGFDVETQEPQ